MIVSSTSRLCLQAAGGCLQHVSGLLSLLTVDSGFAAENRNAAKERSVSTTRSVSMGREGMQEKRKKSAAPSDLYTRENYQALAKQGWSLDACEQVLQKNQEQKAQHRQQQQQRQQPQQQSQHLRKAARPQKGFVDHVNIALNDRINSCISMDDLRSLVEREAHNMTAINMAVVIQKVPKVLLQPDGEPDFTSAALLLDHMANMLLPRIPQLGGPNIVMCMGAFVRGRYTPSGDMLTAMMSELSANNAQKLTMMNLQNLSQLLMSLSKVTPPSGHWPLLQALLDETTTRIQELNGTREVPHTRRVHPSEAVKNANSIASLAFVFDKQRLQSHEYVTALHQWIANKKDLQHLSSLGTVQLWAALRGQFRSHTALVAACREAEGAAADSSSPSAAAAAETGGEAADTLQLDQAGADNSQEADGSLQALQEKQSQLAEFFGSETLDSLAAITAQQVAVMTEREVGQILASIGNLRYSNPELLAAAAAGMERLYQAAGTSQTQLSVLTCLSAAWASVALWQPKTTLLLPLWVSAMERPGEFDGVMAGRLFHLTGWLGVQHVDLLQQQRQSLREEMHRRCDRRGPVPDSTDSNPEWVMAVADSLVDRFVDFKPREVAHILAGFSSIPGVVLHKQVFAAAAKHIEMHAHTFTQFKDMEMIAGAFEGMDYKEGLPALRALQEQAEQSQ